MAQESGLIREENLLMGGRISSVGEGEGGGEESRRKGHRHNKDSRQTREKEGPLQKRESCSTVD